MWSQSPGSGRVSVASVTGTKAGDWATTTEIAGLPAASAPSSDAVARKDLFTILASGGILRHYSKDDRRFDCAADGVIDHFDSDRRAEREGCQLHSVFYFTAV